MIRGIFEHKIFEEGEIYLVSNEPNQIIYKIVHDKLLIYQITNGEKLRIKYDDRRTVCGSEIRRIAFSCCMVHYLIISLIIQTHI